MSSHDELLKKFTRFVKQLAAMPEEDRKRLLKMTVEFFEHQPTTDAGDGTGTETPGNGAETGDGNGNGEPEPAAEPSAATS